MKTTGEREGGKGHLPRKCSNRGSRRWPVAIARKGQVKMVEACFNISGCLFSLCKFLHFARFAANRAQNFIHPTTRKGATKLTGF